MENRSQNHVDAAARAVLEDSNPVGFWRRIRGLPVVKQLLWIADRFL